MEASSGSFKRLWEIGYDHNEGLMFTIEYIAKQSQKPIGQRADLP